MLFRILGPLGVEYDGRAVPIGSPLQRRLLAVLLVHARTVVSADRLVDVLWGEQPPTDARQGLWTCVSRLRHALKDPAGGTARDVLISRPPGYVLMVQPEQIDAGRVERLLDDAARIAPDRPRAAGEMLQQALSSWRGPTLVEFSDASFAAAEAARLDELRLVAMERRFDVDLALGVHAELVGQLRAFTTLHPLRERPRAQLMLALYRSGRQAEALEAFSTYRRLLEDELGLDPSPSLRAQQTAILQRSAELDRTALPAEELDERPSAVLVGDRDQGALSGLGLPAEGTSFIGRSRDIALAAATISQARLVTLTGVGGVGKTRLAARAAVAVSGQFTEGIAWCELAPLTGPDAVAPALATSLGVRRQVGAGVLDSVVTFLAPKRLLLVLDNCEHVLAGVRPLVEAILRGCPGVVVLATSRERLALDGERVRGVDPLPLPDTAHPQDATAPAVALFVERARAVRPDLDLDADNLAAIVAVCRQLDGLPLSLELAAARIRSLNPVDLSARMAGRLDLLSPADADTGRHGTLRAVLDWSYNLLTPSQRRLFDRMSVFSGSFDLAAAERVGSGGGIAGSNVIDLLAALVDASMITVGATGGRVRYSLLETLRGYGSEHLRSYGEADAVRLEHATHYASVAEEADRGLRGADEAEWVTIVDRELDNLRAAHQWLVRAGRVELALRLSRGLHYYMLFRFRDEVVSWGQVALELRGADQHPLFAEVCGAVGEGLTARGEMDLAAALAVRALTHAAGPDDHRRMFGLRLSGMISLYVGRLDDGYRDHAEMLRLARLHDRPYEAGMALLGLAQSCTYAGDPEKGLGFADEQYRVVEPLGNPSMLALASYDRAEALSMLEPDRAIEPYQRAIGLAESAGATFVEGIALVGLASLLGRSGDPSTALPLFRSIVDRWRRMGVWTHQWTTLRNLVQLLLRMDSWGSAAVLVGAINAHSTAAQAFGADAERMGEATELLMDRLGSSSWSEATGRGAAMSDDAVVTFACDAIDQAVALLPGRDPPPPPPVHE
ncbi:AfsR/SARP family transcriptional regulator [Angustibacter sp. McL0619]|uniref:AfsR/SARP family transcriptional regulator n=1 Tax=Angustibacter sp. McL0619 TaxID=3415676 RepID=UPI003CF6CCF1